MPDLQAARLPVRGRERAGHVDLVAALDRPARRLLRLGGAALRAIRTSP